MSTATLNGLLEYLFATLTPSNQKWLGEHLIEHAESIEAPLRPYTMEEINAMLEESERDFEAGNCYSTEEAIKMCMEETSKMQLA